MSRLVDALRLLAARASDVNHPDGWLESWPGEAIDTVEAAATELTRLQALLREVEWAASDNNEDAVCPVCYGNRDARMDYGTVLPQGHTPDCRLAAALRAREEGDHGED